MDMEARAEISGWGKAYATNPDFKAIFDEMHEALDGLPPPLHARGQELPFPQLHHACLGADLHLVAALLDAGIAADAYPCTEDEDDEPALVWLARDDLLNTDEKIRLATLLLDRGADVNEGDPLEHAKEADQTQFVAFLLSRGAG
ncbi:MULTISPECIES: ankyrin repeat domain-containing protein [Stenotrophomonas]|jgi:ankyrin repeat protein|uniref:Ankyrin repeat domain-containing protein n=2 Tax=Stenotrophomonas TaxID=40323 RepID=A0A246HL93_STEMA|nr:MULTISPECIES: ankyrin repeat domain-containing protein [Stenotrophomonas]OWQ52514.1 hypothetical protein CEE60_12275 [Stenotrophomonas maltophilia]TGY33650.1 ankyrin repeat domain-containing protein [Stenotrophomonas maltophilia]